jgi:UDP-N-acetylmuramoyl-tripeptide--D-alanyl-D-alanine ligase
MADPALMGFTELAQALGARLISFAAPSGGFGSVSVDSRKVEPGGLFVALEGAREDGHRHVEAAFKAGAAGALVARSRFEDRSFELEEKARGARAALLVAEDTLGALQRAAGIYLEGFPRLLRVGITGSSGKTTTKEIAAAMIGREKSVVVNPGNLNSETGLPLAVFGVRSHHEVGIFEVGMNRRNEVAELARVLKPHIALVTNIGTAHIGILGSREGIAEEKRMIFSEFSGAETALIPEDDDFRDFLAGGLRGKCRFYGPEHCPELGAVRDRGLEGTEITWEGVSVLFRLPGLHNLRNALGAAAIARLAGVSGRAIVRGLESAAPLFGRSEVIPGPVTVIRDCYNANPESAAAAVALCDGLDWPGRRVYVLGAMLELGDASPPAHRDLGRALAASAADMVFLFGRETREAAAALAEAGKGFIYTETMEVLSRRLGDYVRPGDLVLLKGSRGCALERLGGILNGAAGPAAAGLAEGVS